jgi:hypothetical protein
MPIRIQKKEVATAFIFFVVGVSAAQLFEESSILKENRKATQLVVNHCNKSLEYSKQLQDNLYASFVTVSNCFGKGTSCDLKKLWSDISVLDEENARLNERLDREKKDLEQATQAVRR